MIEEFSCGDCHKHKATDRIVLNDHYYRSYVFYDEIENSIFLVYKGGAMNYGNCLTDFDWDFVDYHD